MKEFFPMLHAAPLFSGISGEELTAMLSCLAARIETFPKGARLLRAGDAAEEVGLVLAGSVLIVQEDIWGNRNILSKAGPGQTFAEVFACAPGTVLNVSVEAESAVTVMFLRVKRILSVCSSACVYHGRIIGNLLGELAEKNLLLNEKLTHMGQRTTRAKLMSYLSAEAQRRGSYEFDIPFSRQQLADYLGVERSGLSLEMESIAYEKGVTLETALPAECTLRGNADYLQRIVSSLLENALKYEPAGGRVQLTLIREKKKVRLSVQNFGSTIPEADLPHVFDRFYRSDKSRKSESGSFGLGLAITKEMAEKLGGEISVASTAEAGTVFQVIFSL